MTEPFNHQVCIPPQFYVYFSFFNSCISCVRFLYLRVFIYGPIY